MDGIITPLPLIAATSEGTALHVNGVQVGWFYGPIPATPCRASALRHPKSPHPEMGIGRNEGAPAIVIIVPGRIVTGLLEEDDAGRRLHIASEDALLALRAGLHRAGAGHLIALHPVYEVA